MLSLKKNNKYYQYDLSLSVSCKTYEYKLVVKTLKIIPITNIIHLQTTIILKYSLYKYK